MGIVLTKSLSFEIYSICRDISKWMRQHNIEGSSRGYVQRIIKSYHETENVETIRKYFLSCLKFINLYREGETGLTVNKVMQRLRKEHKSHRVGVALDIDHSKKNYNRHRHDET